MLFALTFYEYGKRLDFKKENNTDITKLLKNTKNINATKRKYE